MVRPHDGRVDHLHASRSAIALVQGLQHQFPDAGQRPAPELPIDRRPLAERLMQITPRSAGAGDPEHPVQNPPMILRWPTALAAACDHQRLENRPLLVVHQTTNQDCLPKNSLESHPPSIVNPLCQRDLDRSISIAAILRARMSSIFSGPQGWVT